MKKPKKLISAVAKHKKSSITGVQGGFSHRGGFAERHIDETKLFNAYKTHPVIYSAIRARAEAFSGIRLKQVDTEGNEVLGGKILSALKRPNPYMLGIEFMDMMSVHLDVVGQAYIALVETTDKAERNFDLYLLNPEHMQKVTNKKNPLGSYRYSEGSLKGMYNVGENLIVIRESSTHTNKACSPLRVAFNSYTIDQMQLAANYEHIKNGGRAGALIDISESASEYAHEELEVYKESLQGYVEGKDKRNSTFISTMPIKWDIMNESMDMDYEKLSKEMTDDILMVFRTPPVMVGMVEGVNYNNGRNAKNFFLSQVIEPRIRKIIQMLNMDFVKMNVGEESTLLAYDDFVEEDAEQKLKDWALLSRNGAVTLNELRSAMGVASYDGEEGDELIQPRQSTSQGNADESEDPLEDIKSVDTAVLQKKKRTAMIRSMVTKAGELNERFERRVLAVLKTEFDRQEKESIKALKKTNKGHVFYKKNFDIPKATKRLFNALEPVFIRIAVSQSQLTADEEIPGGGTALGGGSEAIATQVKKAEKLIKNVNETTFDQIKKVVADGVEAGASTTEISQAISEKFEEIKAGRAISIARTETTRAANIGRVETYKENSVQMEWSAVLDSDTRHAGVDGQVRAAGENFDVNGYEAEYPADSSLPAGESVNCRCVLIPSI